MRVRAAILFFALASSACSARSAMSALPRDLTNRPHVEKKLGGIIKTKSFDISAQTAATITSNLVVVASDKVTIEGDLYVPQGKSFAFFTPQFTLDGQILVGSHPLDALPPAYNMISACSLLVQTGTDLSIPGGDEFIITASEPQDKKCKTSLDGLVSMSPAHTGNEAQREAEKGGYVAIGSSRALSMTQTVAKKAGVEWHAYAPFEVDVQQALFGGSGGQGYTDNTGKLQNGVLMVSAGRGGDGGDVEITATHLNQLGSDGKPVIVEAGEGGEGGGAAAGLYASLDGTEASPNGKPLSVFQGGGGNGGNLVIKAEETKGGDPGFQRAGSPGNAGRVGAPAGFKGGDGYISLAPTPPPPGRGGNVTLTLALPGKAGTGGTYTPPDGTYYPITIFGGDGGAGNNFHDLYKAGLPGGAGGNFYLKRPPGTTGTAFATAGNLAILLNGFGSGGLGGDGNCGAYDGGKGGNGGYLSDGGLIAFISKNPGSGHGSTFGGGNGGNGLDGGAGGDGGKDSEGNVIGSNGQAGKSC